MQIIVRKQYLTISSHYKDEDVEGQFKQYLPIGDCSHTMIYKEVEYHYSLTKVREIERFGVANFPKVINTRNHRTRGIYRNSK